MPFDDFSESIDVRITPVYFVDLKDRPNVYGYTYDGEVFINISGRRGKTFLWLKDR